MPTRVLKLTECLSCSTFQASVLKLFRETNGKTAWQLLLGQLFGKSSYNQRAERLSKRMRTPIGIFNWRW